MLWSQWKLDKRFVVLGNTIPGPSGIPLVGNLFSVPHSGPGNYFCFITIFLIILN